MLLKFTNNLCSVDFSARAKI